MLIFGFKGLISMESIIRKQRKGSAKARIRLKPLAQGGERVPPIMAYTARLCSKGVLFHPGFRCMKG